MTHSPPFVDYGKLEFLAFGKSGIVYGSGEARVLKEYFDEEHDRVTERRVFTRLGLHPNIVRLLGALDNGSIILERGEPLRMKIVQQTTSDQIPLGRKLRWARWAAQGIEYIHQNGIVHADVGSHNMILVPDCLKIIDFEGCSIDGEDANLGMSSLVTATRHHQSANRVIFSLMAAQYTRS